MPVDGRLVDSRTTEPKVPVDRGSLGLRLGRALPKTPQRRGSIRRGPVGMPHPPGIPRGRGICSHPGLLEPRIRTETRSTYFDSAPNGNRPSAMSALARLDVVAYHVPHSFRYNCRLMPDGIPGREPPGHPVLQSSASDGPVTQSLSYRARRCQRPPEQAQAAAQQKHGFAPNSAGSFR